MKRGDPILEYLATGFERAERCILVP
jgi:hypothetical protein